MDFRKFLKVQILLVRFICTVFKKISTVFFRNCYSHSHRLILLTLFFMILSSLKKICQNRPNNKLKFCENLIKKVDFRKNLDSIWNLLLKRVSKFVIPQFRDTILVPKITKCEDLLYQVPTWHIWMIKNYKTWRNVLLKK